MGGLGVSDIIGSKNVGLAANLAGADGSPLSPATPQLQSSVFLNHGCSPPESLVPSREGSPDAETALKDAFSLYKSGSFNAALLRCQTLYPSMPHRADLLLLMGACQYQLGQYAACISSNDAAIILCPNLAEAHANLANALQQLGQSDLAIMYYTSAIRLNPSFVDAYANRASAYLRRGQIMQAADSYKAALALNPNLPGVHCGLGDLWRSQGLPGCQAAMQCYSSALQIDPSNTHALHGLAECHREGGGSLIQAIALYRRVLQLSPASVDARTGLAMALRDSGHGKEAEQEFALVAAVKPDCPLALGNLASAYYENGKLDAAISTYQLALIKQPNFPEALNNLGNAFREMGKLNDAVSCYRSCIQLQLAGVAVMAPSSPTAAVGVCGSPTLSGSPLSTLSWGQAWNTAYNLTTANFHTAQQAQRLAVSYNNLAGVLKLQHRATECIAAYQQVVLLQPSPEAYANVGSAYKDAGFHEEAIGAYQQALVLKPDFPEAYSNQFHSKQCICDWEGRDEALKMLEAVVNKELVTCSKVPSVQPFHALGYPFSPQLAKAIAIRYAEQCLWSIKRIKMPTLSHPPALKLKHGERLKVGYVSSDFGNHPLSHLMNSVFGLHDRSKIEVFCYALSADDGSAWRNKIRSDSEHFLDVSQWSSADIAQRISSDGIHLAVNLNGYTKGARNDIFAMCPAPVQCQYMGFPATMGASYIPYIILDKVVCPPESRDAYSECVAYMPGQYSYFSNDYRQSHKDIIDGAASKKITRADIGLPEDKMVYYCANQLYKYDPETFTVWCNILKRVPDSVLWLLRFPPAGEARVKLEAARRGVDPSRIIFTDVAQKADHIARSGLADLFLDTPHCNAHTTGCDVLWSGVPMVTLPLERMASRVAASLCSATGLGKHMIVGSLQEYEDQAVELGLNSEKRLALRSALQEARMTCPLFDTYGWMKAFEQVLLQMWDIHCEGNGPKDFEISMPDNNNNNNNNDREQ